MPKLSNRLEQITETWYTTYNAAWGPWDELSEYDKDLMRVTVVQILKVSKDTDAESVAD